MEMLRRLFSSGDFMPHGFCYLWNPGVVWLHLISDTLIALSYLSIPITLIYFIRKRRDLPFDWMFGCFGLFIVACGATHVMEIWNIWHADYWLAGAVKAVTALASVPTAVLLVQLVPRALALPSPKTLEQVNLALVNQADELARANAELAAVNQALQRSEDRSRSLFDSNPHPVWVYDMPTLAFLDVNQSAVRSYGYSREEFLSKTIKDIRPSEEISALLESVSKAPPGAENSGVWRHRKKDGTLITVEITSHPIVFDGREARLVVATDVTERKRVEEALQASERKFRTLAETASDAIISANAQGNVIYFNRAAVHTFGYASEEVVGRPLTDLMPERYRDAHRRGLDLFLRTGEARVIGKTVELEGLRKDGAHFPIELSLSTWKTHEGTFFTAILKDITERKQSEQKFKALLDSAPDAMVIVNREGRIELVNAQTEKLFGYARAELLGKGVDMLVPQRFRTQHGGHRQGYFHSPKTREMGAGLELYGLRKDGTEFPVEISLSPMQTEGGTLVSSAIRDVTDRKKVEEALEIQRMELARSNTELTALNKELEAFSYSVSHDLRTPLGGIDGFSQALLEDYSDRLDATGKQHLERVRTGAQRMAALIDDLLELSRITRAEIQREPLDLSEMARSVAAELSGRDPARQIEFVIAPGLHAEGDAPLMHTVLENLLGNAWKFTSRQSQAQIEFGLTQTNGLSTFFVRDNGAGFDPAYAGRLFGAFQRLHGATEFPGTGVGLASAQRVIHRHGGRLWAKSAVNEGATFFFTLMPDGLANETAESKHFHGAAHIMNSEAERP